MYGLPLYNRHRKVIDFRVSHEKPVVGNWLCFARNVTLGQFRSENDDQNFSRNTHHGIRGSQAENRRKEFSRNTRHQFSAKVDFAHLIFNESQKKSEVDQNQPWHTIKTGFAKQLWKVSMQLTGFEGRLWPKMAKKGPKTFRAIHVNSVLPISVFIIPYNVLVTSSVVHSNYCVHL